MLGANEKIRTTPTYFEGLFWDNIFQKFFSKVFLNILKFCNFYLYYYRKFYVQNFKKYVISNVLKPIYKSFLCLKIIITMFNECFWKHLFIGYFSN
jgi:hypothetical protein